eukprot:5521522-Prymnesium_polylepis.1
MSRTEVSCLFGLMLPSALPMGTSVLFSSTPSEAPSAVGIATSTTAGRAAMRRLSRMNATGTTTAKRRRSTQGVRKSSHEPTESFGSSAEDGPPGNEAFNPSIGGGEPELHGSDGIGDGGGGDGGGGGVMGGEGGQKKRGPQSLQSVPYEQVG